MLIIVVLLVATAVGVIYWTSYKANKIANSAIDASKKSQTALTAEPSSSVSNIKTPVALPATDSDGEDLTDVPRYPDSIRTSFDKNDDSSVVNLEYVAKENGSKILDFYKKTLVENGWILRAEDPSALSFSGQAADLSIEIVGEDKLSEITQYQIHSIKVLPQVEE